MGHRKAPFVPQSRDYSESVREQAGATESAGALCDGVDAAGDAGCKHLGEETIGRSDRWASPESWRSEVGE